MLKLVKVQASDLETLMHWRMLPEVTKYMYTDPQLTMEQQYRWFRSIQEDPTCRHWVIQFDDAKIGALNLANINIRNSRCSWGYYIADTSIRGKGFGKLMDYNIYDLVLAEMGLNKLVSEVFAFNERVVKLHEKCGSQVEGILRQHIKKGDSYYDVVVMSILRDEWLERRKTVEYETIDIER